VLCGSSCTIDQGMVSCLLLSSHWPYSAPNKCLLHNLLQLVELMAVCIMFLSLCCFLLQTVPPMAECFYKEQWCHCNCFDLSWNMCNWFCFCHPFPVLLIVTCVYLYLRSIKFGIWGWFSQKGFYNVVFLRHPIILCQSEIVCWHVCHV